MSRLHANTATHGEIAARFGTPTFDGAAPTLTVEGGAGLVVLETASGRALKQITWGFPRVTTEMAIRNEAPQRLGLLADLTNPMWRKVVVDTRYRCLIPLTHFDNPAGDAGSKTRTWFSVEGEPLVAWAGFCRNTPEFGPVFAGLTMTANEAVMPFNDRMPVLLAADEHERWLQSLIQDVISFQFRPPMDARRMVVEHTPDRWRSDAPPPSGRPQLALI